MKVAVKGLERSGTNVTAFMLRENGIDADQTEKHAMKPNEEADVHLVTIKHPLAWCVSVYSHGWIFDWMGLDVQARPLKPDELVQDVRTVVIESNALQHWCEWVDYWTAESERRRVRILPYERTLDNPALVGMEIGAMIGEPVNFELPRKAMLINTQPGVRQFDGRYYANEEWRQEITAEMTLHAKQYEPWFKRFGYEV